MRLYTIEFKHPKGYNVWQKLGWKFIFTTWSLANEAMHKRDVRDTEYRVIFFEVA